MTEESQSPADENLLTSSVPSGDGGAPLNQSQQAGATPPPARRPTLTELTLGGVLIVSENVGSRLLVPDEAVESTSRSLEMVLRPAAEWDTTPASQLTTTRRVTVGMLTDARNSAGRGGHSLFETTDAIGRGLDKITRPVRRSRIMRPVRVRFHRYQQRGEQQIARWEAIGRQKEERSRVVAEASLGRFVQSSVSDLTESEQIQVLVHQVVESQGTGLIEEMLEEVRERMVSLDILFARRTPRTDPEMPAEPPFRAAFLRSRPALAIIGQADQTLAGHYAGFASRAAAFLVDVILLMITLSLATTFVNALISLFNLDGLIGRVVGSTGLTGTITAALAGLAGSIFVITYGVLAWSLNGETLGDILMGIRVLRADGGRVSFGRAVVRMIGAYISGLVLFVGFLWAVVDNRRQGWHDKLAGTVVVYNWPAVPDEQFLREELGVRGVLPRQQRPAA